LPDEINACNGIDNVFGLVMVLVPSHSHFLTKAGNFLQVRGEKVFLTGAVPLYGALYALPKNDNIVRRF
jgi:hypothetical protein